MKGIKFSQDRRFDERIPSTTFSDGNINVEFNMPLSHIKTRCEKDNEDEVNDVRSSTRQEEINAKLREDEKRRKLEEFQKKIVENSKKFMTKQKESKQKDQEIRDKENERIKKLISRPKVMHKKDTPKKEPKKADETNKENDSVNESARDETITEICNLSTVINQDTARQKNELVRLKMFEKSKNGNLSVCQSSFLETTNNV